MSDEFLSILSRAHLSKDNFLDYLECLEDHIEDEPTYETIISWTENQFQEFVTTYDWDLDELENQVTEWHEEFSYREMEWVV